MTTLIQFANKLRKAFPADRPIKVRTTKMPFTSKTFKKRLFGDTQELKTHYLIRINKDSEISIQKDTLLHEWAHCIVGWDEKHDSHSDKWGVCYSKIYREMVGD